MTLFSILTGTFWFFVILAVVVYGIAYLIGRTDKSFEKTEYTENQFTKLEELFLDAVNLYASANNKETKEYSETAKQIALTIITRVNEEQKSCIISSLKIIINLAKKTGLSKKILDRHNFFLVLAESKKFGIGDSIKTINELVSLDNDAGSVVVNGSDGEYLKRKFTDHFFDKDDELGNKFRDD